jgi:short-subunit dehydrogenase
MEFIEQANNRKGTALITGATGGLGKAFAVECASRGWDLFLTDRSQASLDVLACGLHNAYGVNVSTYACDLTDATMRNALFNRLRAESARLSALINVAGTDYEGLFYDQTCQQIQTIIRLNVETTMAMMHEILPFRDQHMTFRIINVSSMAAFYPMPVKATYAASKRFLLDFSLALREEVRELGITVTALCPAGMPTNKSCIDAIEAQGLAGLITTLDAGRVATQTLDAALAGKAIFIPGWVNRVMYTLSSLVPPALIAALIHSRWTAVHHKQERLDSLHVA